MKCLVAIAKKSVPVLKRPLWNSVNSFAYQNHHSCAHVGTILTEMISRANIFRNSRISIVEGDIQTCFDEVTLVFWEETITFWQFRPRLVCALLKELTHMEGTARLGAVSTHDTFTYDKLRQGGADGPWLWDMSVRYLTHLIVERWRQNGRSELYVDGLSISLLWWADNFWIVATNPEESAVMMQDLIDVLGAKGLYVKPSSIKHLEAPHGAITLFNSLMVP